MPQVPTQNNFGVLPQPAEMPHMNAADFGAGSFDELQKASIAVSRVGTEMEKLDKDTARAKARAAYNSYRQGMDETVKGIKSQSVDQAALGSMDAFNDSADELIKTHSDALKGDPTARDLFDSMVASHRAACAGDVLDYQKSALDSFEKQQAAGQLNMSARDYAAEDDPNRAKAHLQEVYGLTHGLVRGFGSGAEGEESAITYDENAHHVAVQSVLAPAIASEVHARATDGDFDGALSVLNDKGGWLHPDVREQMTQNIQESKTQQTVSDYLNQAAHPDKVQSLVDSIDDPHLRSVASQMAPGIISAKQNALDRQHAQAMGTEMQKIQADPSGYVPADPLLEDAQKEVLTTYKNKLLQDSAGPKADDSAAWNNLRFMAIDNPSGFAKIDATDPQIANLLNANQFGHFVKIQNEIRSGEFDATPTPAQKTIQRLLHADSDLAEPDGASAQGSPVYRITQAGHEKLLDLFDRLSILPEEHQESPSTITQLWNAKQ